MMYTNGENEGANVQLERARAALGEVLGSIQDIHATGLNTSDIGGSLAFSVRSIFNVQSRGVIEPGSLEELGAAMERLRDTLQLMQEAGSGESAMQDATATVARVLAILYPVVRALEKIEELKVLEDPQALAPQAQPAPPAVPEPEPEPEPGLGTTDQWDAPPPRTAAVAQTDHAPPRQIVVPEETDIRRTRPQRPHLERPEHEDRDREAPEDVARVVRAAADRTARAANAGQYHHTGEEIPEELPGPAAPTVGSVPLGAIRLRKKQLPVDRPKSSASVPPPGVDERRVMPRRIFNAAIGLQSGTNFFTGFSLDISSGGLFISTYDTLPRGAEVNVNFDLPGGPLLSLNGVVQWIREYNPAAPDMEPGIGVRFVNLTEADQAVINDYIAAHSPIFYEDD